MGLRITHVDAFTERRFRGIAAGVCILAGARSDTWMQNVAREMNLSETAFLLKHGDEYNLRWFTPTVEVDLCGHATLASAHVLWEEGHLKQGEQALFHTRSGLLTASRVGDWIELDFPATPVEPASPPEGLLQALGTASEYVGRNQFDYLVEVDAESTLRKLIPNFTLLKSVSARGVIVTSRSSSAEYDFVSRFFAPAVGIDEDPATGSSHCSLGPYWSSKLDKKELIGYQASARGGVIRVRVRGGRVALGGKAVTVMQAELLV